MYGTESEKIEKLCLDLVDAARKVQPKLPKMSLTHMLLLLYTVVYNLRAWPNTLTRNNFSYSFIFGV